MQMSEKERTKDCIIEDTLLISQGLPSNRKRLKTEISLLYEWSRLIIGDKHDHKSSLWKFLISTLERIYTVTFETKPSVLSETYNCLVSLINSLVGNPKWFIDNKLCSYFLVLCGNISYLLTFRENKPEESYQIISLMSDICLCKNESCISELSPNGIYYFTVQAKILGSLGQYNLALKKLSQIKSFTDSTEDIRVNHLKSKLLFDTNKFEEASTLMIKKIQDQVVDKKLRSSVFNTIGCCLAKQEKPVLASLWFHKAYEDDNQNCISLWNLSLQYRALENFQSEISVLRLLIQVSKNATDEKNSYTLISKMEALYLFGSRSLQLKYYNYAFDSYKELDDAFNGDDYLHTNWKIISCPSVVKIKLEIAYIYYHTNFLSEATNVCDIINGDFPETKEESKPGLLRNFIEGNSNYLDNPKNGYYGLAASLIKSLSLTKLGLEEDAKDILKKIVNSMSLLNIEKKVSTKEPKLKKYKIDISLEQNVEGITDLSPLYEITSLVYANLAILRLHKGHDQDALHLLEVSLLSWPQNIDTLFNYALLLVKLNYKVKASKVWFDAKSKNLWLKNVLDTESKEEEMMEKCFTVSIKDLRRLNTFLS